MEIICIIIIFFFLGLFINNMLPILEGLDCTGGFVYDEDGEVGDLDDEDQTTYNNNKAAREEKATKPSCIRDLNNKNMDSINITKKKLKNFDSSYNSIIVPASKSFEESRKKFLKSFATLDEMVKGDEGNKKQTKGEEPGESECGKMEDPLGAAPHDDIGKPIDSKGLGCN